MSTPVLILGSGALACLFSARMAGSGSEITMLGTWPEGLAALHKYGVRMVEASGGESAYPVRVIDDSDECHPASFALVLVKAWQTARAAEQLERCLAPDGIALTLQNGLGNREILADRLGDRRVALGTTTTGATLTGPGCVRPGGEGVISLEANPGLEPLIDLLHQAGFTVRTASDVEALVWGKLAINAAINPITALLRIPNGVLLDRPDARLLMAEVAQEVAAVAAARGVALPFADPAAASEEVARRTAANHSSMLQDMMRGAPTEIEAICGAIVQAGEAAGLAAPANRTLLRLVKAAVNFQPSPGRGG
jgi:2-dehydropantoate 2-reductase